MATSNSAADKPKTASTSAKAAAKPAVKTIAKTSPPRGIPAPSIKPAAVVVPKMSVVGAMAEAPATASATSGADGPHMLKKQEFVDRVVKASGAKKKDVKLILEAALGVLGDALSAAEELNLPPLGKAKVNKQRQDGNAEILILKLRRGGGSGGGIDSAKEGLAEDGEDD